MVDLFVDNEEAVMKILNCFYLHLWILRIVFCECKLEGSFNFFCVEGGCDAFFSLGEHGEDGFIKVIVDENQSFFGCFDEVDEESMGIEDFSVKEDSALFGESFFNEEIELLFGFGESCVGGEAVLF